MNYSTYSGGEIVTDQDLQHWKYLRKYRNSKGKWVYVYANKKTHNNISDLYKKASDSYRSTVDPGLKAENSTGNHLVDSYMEERKRGEAYSYLDAAEQLINSYSNTLVSKIASKFDIGKQGTHEDILADEIDWSRRNTESIEDHFRKENKK